MSEDRVRATTGARNLGVKSRTGGRHRGEAPNSACMKLCI